MTRKGCVAPQGHRGPLERSDSRDSQEPRATVDSPAGMALEDCRDRKVPLG